MGPLKEYPTEPLVEAVTSLDWNIEHARHAMKTIQETVLQNFGDHLSDTDAIKLLGRLVERRFIRTRIETQAAVATGWRGTAHRAKYVRVPEPER